MVHANTAGGAGGTRFQASVPATLAVILAWLLMVACSGQVLRLGSGKGETPDVPTSGFRTLWESDLQGLGLQLRTNWRESLVAVSGDVVIVAGKDGTVVGVDLKSGSKRWTTRLLPVPWDKVADQSQRGSRFEPSDGIGYDQVVASGTGLVFVTSQNWTVTIDPASGEILWAEVGYRPSMSPASPYLFFGGAEQFHRVDPRTRAEVWSNTPNAFVAATASDLVVSVEHGSKEHPYTVDAQPVTARAIADGHQVWQVPGPHSPVDLIVGADPVRVVMIDQDGGLLALNAQDGSKLWESTGLVVQADGHPVQAEPRLLGMSGDSLFAGVQDKGAAVISVSAETGSRRWRKDLPWQRKPLGSVSGGRVLVTTPDYFMVLTASDGATLASRGDLVGSAVMADRTVCAVIGKGDGRQALTCVELS